MLAAGAVVVAGLFGACQAPAPPTDAVGPPSVVHGPELRASAVVAVTTYRYVLPLRLWVRSSPSSTARVVGTFTRGTRVKVVGSTHGWSRIQRGTGYGWLPTAHLAVHAPPPAPRLADRVAHAYGVATVLYSTTSACGRLTTSPAQGGVLGCYELAHPGRIRVAAWMRHYSTMSPPSLGRSRTDVTARHEVAHDMIRRRCGTALPRVAGSRIEHVADAYSRLYANAPEAYYGYTASDAAKARAIHAGRCS
ncbi:SH3 domain-containing protein [Luteimicrobium subarcticum]|uniref:SH3 domain-containing protein n=1 Tax=Luteimicrobium subarcticum TaxID=620910 RepID=A0A2M8WV45_9MICO|nr:SH3 domain-containing protein [Luteimicrobium subarcticum]